MEGTFVILWVDRNVDTKSLSDGITRRNIKLEFASSAAEAKFRLVFDDPKVDAIVVDVRLESDELDISSGIELLRSIREMDPDIPLVVFVSNSNKQVIYESGKAGAQIRYDKSDILRDDKLANAFFEEIEKSVGSISSYDIEQRKLANQVADKYEDIETERPGTVAYWMFEEELIKEIVGWKERSRKPIINILDLGCGTGRFGKAVSTVSDSAIMTCVDFSGRMLAQAQARLDHERFRFRRSLAERLPEDFGGCDTAKRSDLG